MTTHFIVETAAVSHDNASAVVTFTAFSRPILRRVSDGVSLRDQFKPNSHLQEPEGAAGPTPRSPVRRCSKKRNVFVEERSTLATGLVGFGHKQS